MFKIKRQKEHLIATIEQNKDKTILSTNDNVYCQEINMCPLLAYLIIKVLTDYLEEYEKENIGEEHE